MIPLMKNTFAHERETLEALTDWLLTLPDKLSMGEWCARFEREFAAWQGRKHAVLFNSGGSANLAIFQALLNLGKLQRGDTVGFSALTWATNVMPLMQLGLKPFPIDIDPCTLNISFMLLPLLKANQAAFVTNALGYMPDYELIQIQYKADSTLLIEDNCESLGSELPAGKAGNFSFAASFSFFVAHQMSTIEGGMVCTDDDSMAEMLRMVRANGWDRNLTAEQQAKWRTAYNINSEFEAAYTFYVPGYNLRPTEITGFLGCQQLKYIDEAIDQRIAIFEELETLACSNPDFEVLEHSHMTKLSPFAFPVLCKTAELRNQYVHKFVNAGVEIRPIIAGNITRHPFYAGDGRPLPGADRVERCGFYFGVYPELTRSDMEALKSCLGGDNA